MMVRIWNDRYLVVYVYLPYPVASHPTLAVYRSRCRIMIILTTGPIISF